MVEHPLGKGEADSSILSGSTIFFRITDRRPRENHRESSPLVYRQAEPDFCACGVAGVAAYAVEGGGEAESGA